jgi:hypothetical protein
MRPRSVAAAVAVAVLSATSCGQGSGAVSTTRSSGAPIDAEPSTSASATAPATSPAPPVDLPADAPTTFGSDVDAAALPIDELVPHDAQVADTWVGSITGSTGAGPTNAVVVAWTRRGAPPTESGLEVWERVDPDDAASWHVAYAFTDGARSGVFGVRFEAGDATGDGSPDVLSFEDLGGSGACGIWRVIEMHVGDYDEIFRRQTCDTVVLIAGGDLRTRSAVYAPEDAHCCPSAYRTTTLRWSGAGWDVLDRTTEPA